MLSLTPFRCVTCNGLYGTSWPHLQAWSRWDATIFACLQADALVLTLCNSGRRGSDKGHDRLSFPLALSLSLCCYICIYMYMYPSLFLISLSLSLASRHRRIGACHKCSSGPILAARPPRRDYAAATAAAAPFSTAMRPGVPETRNATGKHEPTRLNPRVVGQTLSLSRQWGPRRARMKLKPARRPSCEHAT